MKIKNPLTNAKFRFWLGFTCSLLLALVFISSGLGKLLGHSAFLLNLSSLRVIPAAISEVIAAVLPWLELTLGVSLLLGVFNQLAALISLNLFAVFALYNGWMIMQGWGFRPCSCMGVFETFMRGSMSTRNALYVDLVLFVLALIVYLSSTGGFLNPRPWFFKKKKQPLPEAGSVDTAGPAGSLQESPEQEAN